MSSPFRAAPPLLLGGALLAAPHLALASAIERNLPPAPEAQTPLIAPADLVPADQDASPIGVALKGVVVLGPTDPVLSKPDARGVDVSRVAVD